MTRIADDLPEIVQHEGELPQKGCELGGRLDHLGELGVFW